MCASSSPTALQGPAGYGTQRKHCKNIFWIAQLDSVYTVRDILVIRSHQKFSCDAREMISFLTGNQEDENDEEAVPFAPDPEIFAQEKVIIL